jgi:hypothetical protein
LEFGFLKKQVVVDYEPSSADTPMAQLRHRF